MAVSKTPTSTLSTQPKTLCADCNAFRADLGSRHARVWKDCDW